MLIITRNNLYSILAEYLPNKGIFLEAGSFDGKDTLQLAKHFPQATIHSFEPVPEIYTQLKKNTYGLPQVITYPLALSDHSGTAPFYLATHPKRPGKICQAGSLHEPKERLAHSPITYPQITRVSTITLNDWATQHAITRVDFIWLDLQGHELAVLKAASSLLRTVTALYVEVNFIAAYNGQPLAQEVHKWIESHGFALKGTDYGQNHTHFFGNHLYINQSSI